MTSVSPSYAVTKYLLAIASTTLDVFVDSDTTYGRMIFRDALVVKLRGSGKRAITVTNTPAGIAYTNHVYGTTVEIRLYADHSMVMSAFPIEDGIDRAWAMYGYLNRLLYTEERPILSSASLIVQTSPSSPPLEGFDVDQDVPYVIVGYDVALVTSP